MDKVKLETTLHDVQEKIRKAWEPVEKKEQAYLESLSLARSGLASAEPKLKTAQEKLDQARKKRQIALVDGNGLAGLNEEIEQLRKDVDLFEDMVIGFRNRIKELEENPILVSQEKNRVKREVVSPLLIAASKEYNSAAEKLSDLVGLLHLLGSMHGVNENGTRPLNFAGSGDLDESCFNYIPAIRLPGEPYDAAAEGFYNRQHRYFIPQLFSKLTPI